MTLMLPDARRPDAGCFRSHLQPKVHFEAPPSDQMQVQMDAFLRWFNASRSLPALARCGIAHLYFVSVHPFEDGNGRIGRAIAKKAIAQNIGQPSLTALATQIEKGRNAYYDALESANKQNEITDWLLYFGQVILDAQRTTETHIQFLIDKAKLYDRLRGKFNERQEKVIHACFAKARRASKATGSVITLELLGPQAATATRDLLELVDWAHSPKRVKTRAPRC